MASNAAKSASTISKDLQAFNDIRMMNWAWYHQKKDSDEWVQFECVQCMLLESKYQQYLKNNKDDDANCSCETTANDEKDHEEHGQKSDILKFKIGTIDFKNMKAEYKNAKGQLVRSQKIKRAGDNKRQRPDTDERHQDNAITGKDMGSDLNLINKKDLGWLAWNWRAWFN